MSDGIAQDEPPFKVGDLVEWASKTFQGPGLGVHRVTGISCSFWSGQWYVELYEDEKRRFFATAFRLAPAPAPDTRDEVGWHSN